MNPEAVANLRSAASPLQQYRDPRAREEMLLSNADRYATWLCGVCVGRRKVELGIIPRGTSALADYADAADNATLVAMLLYPRADVIAAAGHELRLRFLDAHGVQS